MIKIMDPQLTEGQKEGLNNYVNSTPPLINIILWADVSEQLMKNLHPEEIDNCLDLLTIFEQLPVSQQQTIVYRGIGTASVPLVSSGLISTSPQVGEAAKYVGLDSGHLIRIIVPTGCRPLDPAEFGVFNPYDSGDEIILLPGSLTPIAYGSESRDEEENSYYNGYRPIPITTYLYAELPNSIELASLKVLMFQKSTFPDYVREAAILDEDEDIGGYYDEQGNYHSEAEYQALLKKQFEERNKLYFTY